MAIFSNLCRDGSTKFRWGAMTRHRQWNMVFMSTKRNTSYKLYYVKNVNFHAGGVGCNLDNTDFSWISRLSILHNKSRVVLVVNINLLFFKKKEERLKHLQKKLHDISVEIKKKTQSKMRMLTLNTKIRHWLALNTTIMNSIKRVLPSHFISWKSPFLILTGSGFYQIYIW